MEEELKMVTQTMEYERLNNGWTLLFNLNKNQQPIKEAALQKPLVDGYHADEFNQSILCVYPKCRRITKGKEVEY